MTGYRLPDGCSDADFDDYFYDELDDIVISWWESELKEVKVLEFLSKADFEKDFIEDIHNDYEVLIDYFGRLSRKHFTLYLAELYYIKEFLGFPHEELYESYEFDVIVDDYMTEMYMDHLVTEVYPTEDEYKNGLREIKLTLTEKYAR